MQTPLDQLDTLIDTWERQQDAYVAQRTSRFDIVLDSIEFARPDPQTIVDIAGGLGSFSKLILARFPQAKVITLDYDPSLLALARHNLRSHGDRSVIVEANLVDPSWSNALQDDRPDVIVSSTALHWLNSAQLITLYAQLATVLSDGGLFFNADHLSPTVSGPFFHIVSAADDARQQQALLTGVPDWARWWDQFRADDGFDELIAERDRRFAGLTDHLEGTAALHIEALRVAGFAEAGTIWQYFNDFVIYATR